MNWDGGEHGAVDGAFAHVVIVRARISETPLSRACRWRASSTNGPRLPHSATGAAGYPS